MTNETMPRMEFDCKLAHSETVKRISGFNSVKELYERVASLYSIPIDEILFCTLNSNNFKDMESLLGNFLSFGDLIVVHLCGKTKDISIRKTQQYLGLTITDNGRGRAFIKKVGPNEELGKTCIGPGDHIAAINGESTVGLRHYEVAKAIREVPQDTIFTMKLIEPLHQDNYVNLTKVYPATGGQGNNVSLLDFGDSSTTTGGRSLSLNNPPIHLTSDTTNMDSLYDDLTNSSLPIDRLLSKSSKESNSSQQPYARQGTTEDINKASQDLYRRVIDEINSILESFLGINDNTLAIQIYRLAKDNKDSFESFAKSIKSSELSVFNFSDEIQNYLWNSVYQI